MKKSSRRQFLDDPFNSFESRSGFHISLFLFFFSPHLLFHQHLFVSLISFLSPLLERDFWPGESENEYEREKSIVFAQKQKDLEGKEEKANISSARVSAQIVRG